MSNDELQAQVINEIKKEKTKTIVDSSILNKQDEDYGGYNTQSEIQPDYADDSDIKHDRRD